MVKIVAVKIVDYRRESAGTDKWIDDLIVEKYVNRRHSLVCIIFPDNALTRMWVIWLANAG